MKTAEKQAVGYIRVSTTKQAESGVSLDAQRAKIEAWCQANGYKLQLFEDAAVSGTRRERPQLNAALKAACISGTLVVCSLSRLGRSTQHVLELAERLERAGADLVSLTERIDTTGAAGKAFFRMTAVFAEFERDVISERTSETLQGKLADGEAAGGFARYGSKLAHDKHRNNKRTGKKLLLVFPNPVEQKAIKRAQRLRIRGLSLREIAAKLGREGYKPRGGNAWHPQTVKNILEASDA